MLNGASETALGKVKIKVTNVKTKKKWNVDYVVVEDNRCTPLLSRRAAESMGLVTVNYNGLMSVLSNLMKSSLNFPLYLMRN